MKRLEHEVAEIYSPPRVTSEAAKWGFRQGLAMDLTIGWDFRQAEDRRKAWEYVDQAKPTLLIGSPMCTMFSQLQNLTGWSAAKDAQCLEAVEHIEFVVKLYKKQLAEGRYFLHEHPETASSWSLRCI